MSSIARSSVPHLMVRSALLLAGLAAALSGCGPAPGRSTVPAPPPREHPAAKCVVQAECDFVAGIHARLHPGWHARLERSRRFLAAGHGATLVATVTLVVDPRGRLSGAWLAGSSGVAQHDLAAVEATLAAAPFPPPAPDLISDDGFVHVSWQLANDANGCTPLLASLQQVQFPLRRALPLLLAAERTAEARYRLLDALPHDADAPAAVVVFATEVLRQYAGHRDPAVRRAAALGLAATGDPLGGDLVRGLLADERRPPEAAVRLLARSEDPRDLELLIRIARRNDGPASAAAARLAAARGAGREILAALEPALTGASPAARDTAAAALCGLRHPGAERALLVIATSAGLDPVVRACAIDTLGRSGSATAARALPRLVAAPEPGVRAAALVALGRSGRLRLVARYRALDLLRDPVLAVRAAAAATLVRVATSPGEWRRPLAAVFDSGDATSGLAAVDALAAVGGSDAMRMLERLSGHPRPRVTAAAALAYQRLRLGQGHAPSLVGPARGPRPAPVAAPPAVAARAGADLALASADLARACTAARQVAPDDLRALRHVVTQLTTSDPLHNATIAAAFVGRGEFDCPPARPRPAGLAAAVGTSARPRP